MQLSLCCCCLLLYRLLGQVTERQSAYRAHGTGFPERLRQQRGSDATTSTQQAARGKLGLWFIMYGTLLAVEQCVLQPSSQQCR